jgi:hypothetical protein
MTFAAATILAQAAKPVTYQPVDPLTIWIPLIGVLVVGALGFIGALYAANRAGANSDAALARTIAADREARMLERRLTLYGDLLTFVGKRRQHRDVTMTRIVWDGMQSLDPFEPAEVFDLSGRTRAIADAEVLAAWEAADQGDMASINAWNLNTWAQGDPHGAVERVEKAFSSKDNADAADTALEAAIRHVLHNDVRSVPEQTSAAGTTQSES